MLIVIRAIISSCFGCGKGRRNGWLERRWILAWSGGSRIFNYTRLLNCKWLMWRIGHGNRIIPTFTYFAFVTVRGPVLSPFVTLFCGNDTKTLPGVAIFSCCFLPLILGRKRREKRRREVRVWRSLHHYQKDAKNHHHSSLIAYYYLLLSIMSLLLLLLSYQARVDKP